MANIYIYDLSFLVLFTLAVAIFLYRKRSNLKRDGIMYLYRTKVGIKFIDYVGEKYKKTLSVLSYLSVISGYFLMASMIYFLYKLLYIYLFQPKIVQAIKIPPLLPLVPYVPELFKISFLPPFYFTYWIIAIAVIAICHEFAHGIIARRFGVKIKTTGFGFLGPFLAAFVEPDEKQMEKKPKFQQIAILSAGTFANILLTVIFFLLLLGFFSAVYTPSGVMFDSYATGIIKAGNITIIDGSQIKNQSASGILEIIEKNNIQNDVIVGDETDSINLTTIVADEKRYLLPITDLKTQLEKAPEYIVAYYDMPAIRERLKGVIVQIDDTKISTRKDLTNTLKDYQPGKKIKISTKTDKGIVTEEIVLAENPSDKGKAMIGVGYSEQKTSSLFMSAFNAINLFREPGTAYEPIWNPNLTLFIYNLIWWLVLINFSVALINMWPVAIFDGGRAFMLTVWAITKSENFAKIAFKVVTYAILGSLVLLMYGWVSAVF